MYSYPAGRIFLRKLPDTAHSVDGLSDHIHITDETLKDISWWQTFAQSWNGIASFWIPTGLLPSGTLGFGGYWDYEKGALPVKPSFKRQVSLLGSFHHGLLWLFEGE